MNPMRMASTAKARQCLEYNLENEHSVTFLAVFYSLGDDLEIGSVIKPNIMCMEIAISHHCFRESYSLDLLLVIWVELVICHISHIKLYEIFVLFNNHVVAHNLVLPYSIVGVWVLSAGWQLPTSYGSWRQGIKGEMTCTVYVALVWDIIYWGDFFFKSYHKFIEFNLFFIHLNLFWIDELIHLYSIYLSSMNIEFHLWYENYRRHFQIYLQWRCLNFNYNFTEVCSQGSNWL